MKRLLPPIAVALLSACASSDVSYSEQQVSAICGDYCAESGCYLPVATEDQRTGCYARCTQGCEIESDCTYAGICLNELIAYRECELSCRCDRGACREHALKFLSCERRLDAEREGLCDAVQPCGVDHGSCIDAFGREPGCSQAWLTYLDCVNFERNPEFPGNRCANEWVVCSGDVCADCAWARNEWLQCREAEPIVRERVGPPPECAR